MFGLLSTASEPEAVERTVSMSTELERLARQFLEATQNEHRLDAVDEFVAPNFVGRSQPVQGSEGLKAAIEEHLTSFPDLKVTIEQQASDGDIVTTRYVGRATHGGVFHGLEATGKPVEFTVVAIHRFEDGRIAEGWRIVDRLDILEQLGRVAIST
jgi:steroid delta-isomerase-like uncharacterized protein